VQFYNISELDLRRVLDDPPNVADALRGYAAGFSEDVGEIFEKFELDIQISRPQSANLLYLVLGRFVDIDLGPEHVSNAEMGYIYEELVRRFLELSNETAGHHFAPSEVVELMVNLLFVEDDALLSKPGTVKTMLDPACGTGGMLSVSEQYPYERNPLPGSRLTARSSTPKPMLCAARTCSSRTRSTGPLIHNLESCATARGDEDGLHGNME